MSCNEHIVMLPFMAHGHLIPFLALARHIHQITGFTITIANTPLNIQYLKSTINHAETNNIRLVELAFSATDYGLPSNTENSENLSLELIGKFFTASTGLKEPFCHLLSSIKEQDGKSPLCVVSDVFFGWANDVAKRVGTVNVAFSTGGAYGTLAYVSLWVNLPHQNTDSEEFLVPGFPDRCRFHVTQLHQFIRNADGSDPWSVFMQSQISLATQSIGWLCNTVEEIEPIPLQWLRNYIKLPVWPVGPLLPREMLENSWVSGSSISAQRSGKQHGVATEKCMQWLDSHSPGSVLYISFGSQNTISPHQMMELAIGLEASKKPFIWVIRPPIGFDRKGEFRDEWLPEGFAERMSKNNRGLLVPTWAPQLDILAHKSTRVFISHCGWNSVMESLSQGVPIVGWPMAAEQAYNSKMLVEEMGVCVELCRGVQSVISGEDVKKVIEMVMDNEGKGGEMKNKAVEIGQKIRAAVKDGGEGNGSSFKVLDDLVNTLLSRRQLK